MTDSFLDYLRFERNYSEKTIVSYGIDLIKFEEYIRGKDENVDFTTVDADLVRGWVMNLDRGRIYICFCKSETEFTPIVLSFPSKERCDRGGSDVENHWSEKQEASSCISERT